MQRITIPILIQLFNEILISKLFYYITLNFKWKILFTFFQFNNY